MNVKVKEDGKKERKKIRQILVLQKLLLEENTQDKRSLPCIIILILRKQVH